MPERLASIISDIANTPNIAVSPKVKESYLHRLSEGLLTRDENPATHFCVYFAAFDPATSEIFIGHHKKSDFWLFNGGHIDQGEIPEETFLREIGEEWGDLETIGLTVDSIKGPHLLTVTEIENDKQTCKRHFDIWYFVPVDKTKFNPDQEKLAKEFHETRWINLNEAKELITDPATLEAIDYLTLNTSLH